MFSTSQFSWNSKERRFTASAGALGEAFYGSDGVDWTGILTLKSAKTGKEIDCEEAIIHYDPNDCIESWNYYNREFDIKVTVINN